MRIVANAIEVMSGRCITAMVVSIVMVDGIVMVDSIVTVDVIVMIEVVVEVEYEVVVEAEAADTATLVDILRVAPAVNSHHCRYGNNRDGYGYAGSLT